jgi:fucose permease
VSTIFVIPFFGYLIAALLNNRIHLAVGQRGIAFLGPLFRLFSYVPMALHPPSFWVLPLAMACTGFGNGINDSAWNAWVGNLRSTNELLGLIHGAYGFGGIIAPLLASAMITKLGLQWYTYFYVVIGLAIVELIFATSSFWTATAAAYRKRHKLDAEGGRSPTSTATVLRTPIPWLVSLFLFGYVGVEVCLGGWIPTFMIRVRHSSGWLAGVAVTCFWAGLTGGRVVLGFITGRIGEKLAICIYLGLSVMLEILYWKIPSVEASITCVILLGFFLGPLFPAAIVTMTKLLPAEQHVICIGLTAAIGGGGSAVLPFLVGAIAESEGVQVLQPFVLVVLIFITGVWLVLPGGLRKGGLEKARAEGAPVGGDLRKLVGWLRRKAA